MKLKNHLSHEQGLSDLLNYAHLVEDGIILNKDGAFLMTYQFQGPDLQSASGAELDALTANLNRMTTFLDDGWMLHVDEVRTSSINYPSQHFFPDSVSSLIDEERRVMYTSNASHFENQQYLTFVWKFPLPLVKTARHWFIEGVEKEGESVSLTRLLTEFKERVERCIGLLSSQLRLEKLNSPALLSFLNACITGKVQTIRMPPKDTFIDVALGRAPLVGGFVPKIGNHFIVVLSMISYLNDETHPGLLLDAGAYPLQYRFSNRFIALSPDTALRELKRYQKNWHNKVKGFAGIVKEAVFGGSSNKMNQDALEMMHQTMDAQTINSNQSTRFGYWSCEIVLMGDNLEILNEAAKVLSRFAEAQGFVCLKEDINALDAWLGTIPGHGSSNVRRIFMNGFNLAHVLPLHTLWAGNSFSDKSSLLPANSPPVFYADTAGKTPFRFHCDVADVGHQVVLGPTGSGKSTYLGFLIAQFLRYQNAQIFVFDKDYSHQALTHALGGHHYDIGNDALSFCPLQDLETDTKKVRAETFIEDLVSLQNVVITPSVRLAIHAAVEALQKNTSQYRNLTVLRSLIQHEETREALTYYTIDGPMKLMDATSDSLKQGYLQTFEMHWLLNQKDTIYLPVLRYIFDKIESRLEENKGLRPTLIILEEAWLYMSHAVFAKKLKDWLKTLRKKNARVVFATQSLSDLYNPTTRTLSETTAAILESCPTKVYLPNPLMEEELKTLYQKMGLSERQLDIISQIAQPKRHYYVTTPLGNRLIDLGFHDVKPLCLSFIGLSKEKSSDLLACKERYQDAWVYHWLNQEGFKEWASFWQNHYLKREAA